MTPTMQVLYLPGYGNGNPYQRQLQSALAERNVEAIIPDGFSPISVFGMFSVLPILGTFRQYGRPDVLHLHWVHPFIVPHERSRWASVPLAFQFLLELLVVNALGVRIVWTVHNLRDHERRADGVDMAVRHVLGRLVDSIVVHGESVVDTVVDAYRLPTGAVEKVAVIEHGHYLDTYQNEVSPQTAREFLNVGDDETVFLYFGRIRPYKNVPELVRTFKQLDDDSLRLVIVGHADDDALGGEIRRLARDDDRIELVFEFVPNGDIQLYMNAADTVVLPFSEILTSGSTILAMSFGRSVVVPDIGCVGELTDHDPTQRSLTYDPDDPDGLRRAMERTLTVDVEAVGDANRTRAEELDWASVAVRTAAVYRGTHPQEDAEPTVPVPAD